MVAVLSQKSDVQTWKCVLNGSWPSVTWTEASWIPLPARSWRALRAVCTACLCSNWASSLQPWAGKVTRLLCHRQWHGGCLVVYLPVLTPFCLPQWRKESFSHSPVMEKISNPLKLVFTGHHDLQPAGAKWDGEYRFAITFSWFCMMHNTRKQSLLLLTLCLVKQQRVTSPWQ